MSSRRPAALPAAVLVGALAASLGGCSSSDSSDSSGSPGSSGSPDSSGSDPSAVAWNPCDGLTAGQVGRLVGERVRKQTGTADSPRCTFVPQALGGAAYDVSYLFFDGGLDAALDSMGAAGGQLDPLGVAAADSARLAVKAKRSGVLVTGFVQTEGLVQSVNAVQLAPYDRDAVVVSTTDLMAALAKAAPTPEAG